MTILPRFATLPTVLTTALATGATLPAPAPARARAVTSDSATASAPATAQVSPDPLEELLRLHALHRTAHVLGDEALLTRTLADPLLEVNAGRVRSVSRADARRRFGAYFDAVRFLEWEDVRPPRIRLSPDGLWAEVVVEKRVRTVPVDLDDAADADESAETGTPAAKGQRFAWVSRWVSSDGQWRLRTMASTDRTVSDLRPDDRSDDRSDEPAAASADARIRAYGILHRAREALGGAEAVARVHTLRYRAEVDGPTGAFVTEVASARDGRVSFTQRFPDRVFAAGRDLEGPWTGAEGAASDSLGRVLSTVIAAHELHLLALAPAARYSAPAATGREELDGRPVDVVELTDALGASVRFFYDAESGLPVGFEPVDHTGRGDPRILTCFSDWREVGDVLLPHLIRIEQGEDEYRYRIVEASTDWVPEGGFRPGG